MTHSLKSPLLHYILTKSPVYKFQGVVEFTTTCAISAYHHQSCEFEPHSWRGVLDPTLWDKVCQWLFCGYFGFLHQ